MTNPEDVAAKNERSLQTLVRSITLSQGEFSLILVRCNYRSLQQRIVSDLYQSSSVQICEITLPISVQTLYTAILAELGDEKPLGLIVFGLESVKDLDTVLISANQVREEFRKNFTFPILLWVNDQVLQKLIRLAPDFEAWGTIIEFAVTTDELVNLIRETADEVFTKVLNAGAGIFLDNAALNLAIGSPRRTELKLAQNELQSQGVKLDSQLKASLEFVLGRDTASMPQSRQHYERSLALWQQNPDLEKQGCVLHSLGLWWRTYAVQHLTEQQQACTQAKDYFQQCIELFEQANRSDLVAKFINPLGEVLQKLQQWDELETIANKALALYQNYPDSCRLARAYGFLAEVVIAKSAWIEAKQAAEQALSLVASAKPDETNLNLDWVRQYHQGWYLFALARAQKHLDQLQEAIQTLETARTETKPQYDPELYIWILAELRNNYFQQGQYLTAFQIKQEQRSIEQQYHFRAFIGAGRLQAKQQVINPALGVIEEQGTVTEEISASGRQQDVNRLVERMGRDDHKLTVIYGQSGVGKSSIVQAGLIPVLQNQAIGSRDVLPVLLQVYTDWIQGLGWCLTQTLGKVKRVSLAQALNSTDAILQQLRQSGDRNLLTILIFDQFEEFFFIYKEPKVRLPFYEFFRDCLNTPYVKVILSLREDYLHYLLEFNRLTMLEVINNNILDKLVLYYLGNFSPEDTKSVIQSLTATTQLLLEPLLIDELVTDLAGEIGEVRPIELQVVGAQLQTDKITTLEQYREQGPKERLVGRFLEEVVQDCGAENEQIAKLILYLLTDENNTRPLKTRADLELELDVKAEKLDLVLEILVQSGIVLRVPASPKDRYQLVHDYLVPFVRQQQSARLIAELEKEREQRKLTEAKLNQALKQQLKSARRATFTLAGLLAAIGGFAVLATVVGINLYLTNLSDAPKDKSELEQLASAIKAGKRLKQLSIAAIPETKYRVVTALNQAVYGVKELHRLEGHQGTVTSLSYSPDGKKLASASEDKTVKVWSFDGKKPEDLLGHTDIVNSVAFSFDGKLLASGSEDKTVKIWRFDGTPPLTLKGHKRGVTSVSFSPNHKLLVSGSKDNTVKIWSIDGKEIKILPEHSDSIIAVNFSSDGKFIASASKDDTIRIWKLDGKEIKAFGKPIDNDGAINFRFSEDSKNIIALNQNGIKYYALDGTDTIIKSIDFTNTVGIAANTNISPNGKAVAFVRRDSEGNRVYINNSNEIGYRDNSVEHSESVTYTSFSPDNKFLATASNDKAIRIWKLKLDRILSNSNEEDKNSVNGIHFSSNGKTIVTTSEDNTVKLWNSNGNFLKTLKKYDSQPRFSLDSKTIETYSTDSVVNLWSFDHQKPTRLQGYIRNLWGRSFSPDEKIIAAISEENKLNLWRQDGNLIKSLKGHTGKITTFEFSPDSKIIASIGDDKIINLWSTEDGKLIKALNTHKNQITQVFFSNDSKIIASIDAKNVAKLWRSDGSYITTLSGHIDGIKEVRFSPDSQIIASRGDDNLVNLWRSDGSFIQTLKGHTNQVTKVSFSPNANMIASFSGAYYGNSNSTIYLWKRDGQLLKSIDDYSIQDFEFSPDSRIIASINSGNVVKLWSMDDQQVVTLKGHNDEIRSVNFSDDGKLIATTSQNNTVKLWNKKGEELQTFREYSDEHYGLLRISADGKMITALSQDGEKNTINIWNRNGKKLQTIEADEVNFSPNSKYITSFSKDSRSNYTIKFWSEEGKELKSFSIKRFTDSSFSSDGKTVALVTIENYYWKRWDINGRLLGESKVSGEWSNGGVLSPDGKIIASISDEDKTVKLWSSDGALIKALTGHTDKVSSVIFSPDVTMIASASDDRTVKLWKSDGTLIKTLEGHTDKVSNVIFSPDGTMIASASDDKTVKLWKSDGTPIKTLEGHTDKVKSVKFSPDSKMIVSISGDNRIKIWRRDGTLVKTSKQSAYLDADSLSFSPDGNLLGMIGGSQTGALNLDIVNGYWFKDTNLHNINSSVNSLSFSPDNKTIALATDNGVVVSSLDLDYLLSRACNWARGYLKNNPNVEDGDRNLCDDVK